MRAARPVAVAACRGHGLGGGGRFRADLAHAALAASGRVRLAGWRRRPPRPPITVPGYVVTFEVRATAPGLQPSPSAAPEAQALASRLKGTSSLREPRLAGAGPLAPGGPQHRTPCCPRARWSCTRRGSTFYVIADPKAARPTS